MKRRNVLHVLAWFGLTFGGGSALMACPLDPAKVPPCSGKESWPDPCAMRRADAGKDGSDAR